MGRNPVPAAALIAAFASLGLFGCATGKAEVPESVRRYTGYDEGCHSGALGGATAVNLVNKTAAGATVGGGRGRIASAFQPSIVAHDELGALRRTEDSAGRSPRAPRRRAAALGAQDTEDRHEFPGLEDPFAVAQRLVEDPALTVLAVSDK